MSDPQNTRGSRAADETDMSNGDVETLQHDGKWRNQVVGEPSPVGDTYHTQAGAAEEGRQIAVSRQAEHIIKDKDGHISERNDYGQGQRDDEATER
ncbi:DUF2188 domain-containing protein [Microbacterium sp. A196]|uniref:DUF2188 domain-containing protein n=1 Tax=unclassified Microbacterium TaxID=2609290 RepID=UPI003FD4AD81